MKVNTTQIKREMARKCMNVPDLANAAGLSHSTVLNCLSGNNSIRTKTLGQIAVALDVDAAGLIENGEGEIMSDYYRATDVAKKLDISKAKAYSIMQELNKELKEKGYITIAGRCPKEYFDYRFSLKKVTGVK